VRTVLNQLSSVFRKLGIRTRDELKALLGEQE
jgi:DNA-binding CsgD family transcriptional regulator